MGFGGIDLGKNRNLPKDEWTNQRIVTSFPNFFLNLS